MHIRTLSSLSNYRSAKQIQQTDQNSMNPDKKSIVFQFNMPTEKSFADDLFFHAPGLMPHLDSHRPVVKRRLLRIKEQAKKQRKSSKCRTSFSSKVDLDKKEFTTITANFSINKNNDKKQDKIYIGKHKFLHTKHAIVRQVSQIPQYAKNIMKPCKIEAINIVSRPYTSRNIPTSTQNNWMKRKTHTLSQTRKHKLSISGLTHKQDLFQSIPKNPKENGLKIEPWEQKQDQYTLY